MPKTKRVHVLMEPGEFAELERLARRRNLSVSDVIREAARAHLERMGTPERAAAAERFLSGGEVNLPAWKTVKEELERRHGEDIP
jgi:Arc/MetJ-type ribon-helix-helix transcriptional regulator